MTATEPDQDLRAIDAAIAERLFGWKRYRHPLDQCHIFLGSPDRLETEWLTAEPLISVGPRVPHYSTDWNGAMKVRDAMVGEEGKWDFFQAVLIGVVVDQRDVDHLFTQATWAHVQPVDICKAALATLDSLETSL